MYKLALYGLTYISLTIMIASLIYILSVTFEAPYHLPWPAIITTTVAFGGVLAAFVLNNRRISNLKLQDATTELGNTSV